MRSVRNIGLSDSTKADLTALKVANAPYDAIIGDFIQFRGVEGWRDYFERRAALKSAEVRACLARNAGNRSLSRDPGEQRLLAEAARDQFRMWIDRGLIVELGPRRYRFDSTKLRKTPGQRGISIRRRA